MIWNILLISFFCFQNLRQLSFLCRHIELGDFLSQHIDEISDEYKKRGLVLTLGKNSQDDYYRQETFINVDPILFHNVIINIFENSVKYKDTEHGRLEIEYAVGKDTVEIRLTEAPA
jgi:K+-sensing histidine kinase KdpD